MGCKFPIVKDRLTGKYMKENDGKLYYRWNNNNGMKTAEIIDSDRFQLIPCRRCTECRLAYSREWAARCMLENFQHEQSWFLTLTYEPATIPTLNLETGELYRGGIQEVKDNKILIANTLYKDDPQAFIKRLRRHVEYHTGEKIRYYMCGEYGSTTKRPHYHMIVFNLNLKESDLILYKINKEHQPLYQCPWIEKIWGHGFITVGAVTWNSCAYVARYIMKKVKGPDAKEYYHMVGRTPEYTQMSLKPGIGTEYYNLNKEQIYKFDKIILPGKKAQTIRPPKYFDKLYDIEEPEKMAAIKTAREENARLALQLKMSKTTNELWEQLKVEHEAKQEAYKKLIRPLE